MVKLVNVSGFKDAPVSLLFFFTRTPPTLAPRPPLPHDFRQRPAPRPRQSSPASISVERPTAASSRLLSSGTGKPGLPRRNGTCTFRRQLQFPTTISFTPTGAKQRLSGESQANECSVKLSGDWLFSGHLSFVSGELLQRILPLPHCPSRCPSLSLSFGCLLLKEAIAGSPFPCVLLHTDDHKGCHRRSPSFPFR